MARVWYRSWWFITLVVIVVLLVVFRDSALVRAMGNVVSAINEVATKWQGR